MHQISSAANVHLKKYGNCNGVDCTIDSFKSSSSNLTFFSLSETFRTNPVKYLYRISDPSGAKKDVSQIV